MKKFKAKGWVNTNYPCFEGYQKIKKCFKTQFKSAGFESSVITTKIGKGARVIR